MLELIREMLPATRRVAVLANAADPFTKSFLEQIEAGGRTLGVVIRPIMVRETKDFDAAFVVMVKEYADAVIVQPSLPRKAAADLAVRHRLPPISPFRLFPLEGGLMSYWLITTTCTAVWRHTSIVCSRAHGPPTSRSSSRPSTIS
jgi:putative ABC transport system substrate-binding protein